MTSSGYDININKAIFYIFISTIITAVSIIFFIVPLMRETKISTINNRHAVIRYNQIKKIYEERKAELTEISTKNKIVITALNKPINEELLEDFLAKKMDILSNKEVKKENFGSFFIRKELLLSTQMHTPDNFGESILALNHFDSLTNLEFPISMVKDGDALKVSFVLSAYSTIDLNATYDITKNLKMVSNEQKSINENYDSHAPKVKDPHSAETEDSGHGTTHEENPKEHGEAETTHDTHGNAHENTHEEKPAHH